MPFAKGEPFSLEKWSRIEANLFKLNDDLARKRVRFQHRPLMLEYSTNNRCNLRCTMCRPEGITPYQLPPRVVEEVLIDALLPDAVVLVPSSGSEPFLGDLETLSEGCRKYEVQLILITNGTLMTRERIEAVAPVIGRLHVSLDSHDPETYESIRQGAKFEQVKNNVKAAGETARRHGFELLVTAVFSTAIIHRMDGFIRFAADLGADAVEFQKIIPTTEQAAAMDVFSALGDREIASAKEKAVRAAESSGIDIHFNFDRQASRAFNKRKRRRIFANELEQMMLYFFPKFCFMAASYVKIGPDGVVLPCSRADTDLAMGSVLENSFDAVWNGKAYRNLRKNMFRGRHTGSCEGCMILDRRSTTDFDWNRPPPEK